MLQRRPYGQEVDWWALGVTMYVMMVGDFPFQDSDDSTLECKIKFKEVEYPETISEDAVQIMRRVSIVNIETEALHVLE
jgi:serine/threonine protein kinase